MNISRETKSGVFHFLFHLWPAIRFPLDPPNISRWKLVFNPILDKKSMVVAYGEPFIKSIARWLLKLLGCRDHDIHWLTGVVVDLQQGQWINLQNHTPFQLFTIQKEPGRIPPKLLLVNQAAGMKRSTNELLLERILDRLPLAYTKANSLVVYDTCRVLHKKVKFWRIIDR